ncbi:MAG: hypothetical protein M0C28_02805 [Candidatus Moduliflexus flocculans]|nr:hypothetical protein [Candidatus Moduliflexus flocculans]
MVDGGKPQLGAAEKALAALGLSARPPRLHRQEGGDPVHARASRRRPPRPDLRRPQARPGRPRRDPPLRHRLPPRPPREEELRLAPRRHPGARAEKKAALLVRYPGIEAIGGAAKEDLVALVGAAPRPGSSNGSGRDQGPGPSQGRLTEPHELTYPLLQANLSWAAAGRAFVP